MGFELAQEFLSPSRNCGLASIERLGAWGLRGGALKSNFATDALSVTYSAQRQLAGRQGFELGARPVSNVVMARDFWFQALQTQAVTSLRFVHCRPPESARLSPRRGDNLETGCPCKAPTHCVEGTRPRPRAFAAWHRSQLA